MESGRRVLADKCIQLLSSTLKRDICGLGDHTKDHEDVDSARVEQALPPAMQYACSYWLENVQKGGIQVTDNGREHQFLQEHLLHWLEAMFSSTTQRML